MQRCDVCGLECSRPEAVRWAVFGGGFIVGAEWFKRAAEERLERGERPRVAIVRACSRECADAAYDAVEWRTP